MVLVTRVHNHKAKIKRDANDDTFRPMHEPGTPRYHKYRTSHFDVIKKCYMSTRKQGDIDYDKHTQVIKNPFKK